MPDTPIPQAGANAPDFELPDGNNQPVRLSGLKGKPVVLYFYPKDNTPGCTVEANGFQKLLPEFQAAGVDVLGVSPDNAASHCRFAGKFGLAFTLLSDTEHAVAAQYGVWVEKNRYGRKYWGIQRATFLIDREGRVARVWPNVKPDGHAEEVLAAVQALA